MKASNPGSPRPTENAKPYAGALNSDQAATAMQAARLNAIELLDTADILHTLRRFPHSLAFSILAIEEIGKLALLQGILLGQGNRAQLWKWYRRHEAKTSMLNLGIAMRVRALFPEVTPEQAQEIMAKGPTPAELETQKQRAIYSDCLEQGGEFLAHLPKNVDWRQLAWERLCEAKALAFAPRDRTPEELEVWIRHVGQARESGKSMAEALPDLHKELVAKGYLKEGSWEPLLSDLTQEEEAPPPES